MDNARAIESVRISTPKKENPQPCLIPTFFFLGGEVPNGPNMNLLLTLG